MNTRSQTVYRPCLNATPNCAIPSAHAWHALRPALGFLLLVVAFAIRPLEAQQLNPYAQAQQAFANKSYREAATLFAAAAETEALNPAGTRSDALLMQSKALINLNDFAAADPALRRQVALTPRSPQALYLLAFVLHRENKARESLALYTEAAAIQPPQPDDLRIVALDYVLLDDYVDAIHWLERALAANPSNAEAWYALGRAQMNQGDFVQAERDFNKTLALTPDDPKAFDNLGLSLEAQNRTEEALASYRRAIAIQTNSGRASEQPLLNLGTLLNAKTRSSEAIEPLQQAVTLAPKCPRCHEELARADLATGQEGPATREMEQAVSLDIKNPRLHYQLGQIYRHAGLSAKADAELKTSASLYGSHSTSTDR